VPRAQKNYYPDSPYQIVQIWPDRRYPPPPFRVDGKLEKALRKAVSTLGVEHLKGQRSAVPSTAFTNAVYANYGS
jgi:hypothetical protein